MYFNIQTTIGGSLTIQGYYSNSSDPERPVAKHMADGITTTDRQWISRSVIANWHTAQVHTPPTQLQATKKAWAATAQA